MQITVPGFQEFMLPVIEIAAKAGADGLPIAQLRAALAEKLQLSDDALNQVLPSGRQTTFANRVHWACTFLRKAGLLDSPRRGWNRITDRGSAALAEKPGRMDISYLRKFPEFNAFRALRHNAEDEIDSGEEDDDEITPQDAKTPLELMEEAHRKLRKTVADDLLERIKAASPAFFEKLVIKLLLKMGYGGSLKDAGKAIGKSGDGGVDGIIKEDRLGLDVIYVQAKRWDGNPVGRPAVQQFAGALQGHHAAKGILITTSRFTPEARDFVRGIGSKIVLIDGDELANYLLDFNVGVYVAETYELKRIDSDFFEDED